MSSLQQLVLTYFRGVDEQDPGLIFETLAPDCVFSVETHGVELHGHNEIQGMFDRLWSCLLYTSPSPRDATLSRMPSSA